MMPLVPKLAEKARPLLVYFGSLGLIGMLCFQLVGYVASSGAYLFASLPAGALPPSRVDQFYLAQAKQRDQSGALVHPPVLAMEEPALPASVIAAQLDAVDSSPVDSCRTDEADCVNEANGLLLPSLAKTNDSSRDGRRLEAVRPRARPAPRLRPVSAGYRWAGY
jgi:hypothetical protein